MDEVTEYREALGAFLLAAQEVINAVRTVLPVTVHYWVCTQNLQGEHVFDFDDWRIISGGNHWRTMGHLLCPKCGGILEHQTAKVYKHLVCPR